MALVFHPTIFEMLVDHDTYKGFIGSDIPSDQGYCPEGGDPTIFEDGKLKKVLLDADMKETEDFQIFAMYYAMARSREDVSGFPIGLLRVHIPEVCQIRCLLEGSMVSAPDCHSAEFSKLFTPVA